MTAYYNEIDPFAAQWLRNLIKAGIIAPGIVDERSIEDITPDDLRGFTQCHFFAGIGVWSYALRRAGWPDDRPVWTGSCPCQPFSAAGKGAGFADERHLWPAWFHLIDVRRPVAIFGEQVASKDGLAWLDLVQADLEGADYTFGANDLCAAGFGAPHIRQRLYFCGILGNPRGMGLSGLDGWRPGEEPENGRKPGVALGDTIKPGLEGYGGNVRDGNEPGRIGAIEVGSATETSGPCNGFWRDAIWLPCRDGKARPTKPGIFPLAHGATARVGRLRAYGNCIVAPQAEEFIRAYNALRRLKWEHQ